LPAIVRELERVREVKPLGWPVRELASVDCMAYEQHLLALGNEDRRLRFGTPPADTVVRAYVASIDFERDALFGLFSDDLTLVGAAHLARGEDHAELGVSVLPEYRARGLGGALLERAMLRARNWHRPKLFMHCLRENATMMHLAHKLDMHVATEAGEADAWLELAQPDAASYFGEVFAQRVALFDFALKAMRMQMQP
jgi:GNAT superfamily N-acetyltransferase